MHGEADTSSRDRSRTSWQVVLLWNVVIFLVGAEFVGIAAYWHQTRQIYYVREPSERTMPIHLATVDAYRIHPYFGFQLRPHSGNTPRGVPANNNHGFRSDWDFPRPRQGNEFLIGVFGGSVASYLAQFENEEGVIAQQVAAATGLGAADVLTLNFAQGGFKQPQQVQILSYFLAVGQELDAVVNIDGFNEVALGALNQDSGFESSQPSIEHILGLQSVTPISSSSQRDSLSAAREAYTRYAESYNRAWSDEGHLAIFFLYHFFRYKMHHRNFEQGKDRAFASTIDGTSDPSWLYLQRHEDSQEGEGDETGTDWQAVVEVWANGAATLADLAAAKGIPHVHVLQPNQYYRTARKFSIDEQATAINQASPYRPLIEEGYPLLESRARQMQEVDSLLDLFDEMAEPAYSDDCCHYSHDGNRLLAERIGSLLVERLHETRRPPAASRR